MWTKRIGANDSTYRNRNMKKREKERSIIVLLTALLPNLSQIIPQMVELRNIPMNTTVVIRASCHELSLHSHLKIGDRIARIIISIASAI